jgi:hypothetical protein
VAFKANVREKNKLRKIKKIKRNKKFMCGRDDVVAAADGVEVIFTSVFSSKKWERWRRVWRPGRRWWTAHLQNITRRECIGLVAAHWSLTG